ncbi:hypothetical protein DY000_02029930 [Brassica cretica]|uniref:F-box domain-containing protein n=1 Tax=Brassica cretica TaxID=69181 RepID=A0ABQ7DIC6_BRACR|nr:hypothetical protein DY000_02029930 [Brassica cretica]
MKSRRRNVPEDPQTIRRRSSRLSADELLSKIPIDLVIEIFSRLPLKSIARCRCVSKRWASALGRSDFTELFLTKSLACPQLLFACQKESELIFLSSPQPKNPDEAVSLIAADHHMTFPFERVDDISISINGYVCITDERILKGRKTPEDVLVICNPSTGQSFTLPKIPKLKKMKRTAKSFFVYDPIEKQHKVLAMARVDGRYVHQVLTLKGTRNLTWRMIECSVPHYYPGPKCICIDGVLYYGALGSNKCHILVCFDVRSEKYSSIKAIQRAVEEGATLVNYKGKLASLRAQPNPHAISGTSTSFEMWILEDPEKHEWSSRIYKLPPVWKDVVAGEVLFFKGVTATNEIVLSPKTSSDIYYVYYYNFDKESITRVEFQGMKPFRKGWGSGVFTLLNHVEDVKLI